MTSSLNREVTGRSLGEQDVELLEERIQITGFVINCSENVGHLHNCIIVGVNKVEQDICFGFVHRPVAVHVNFKLVNVNNGPRRGGQNTPELGNSLPERGGNKLIKPSFKRQ